MSQSYQEQVEALEPQVNLKEDGTARRYFINPENGHVVETQRGGWVRYVDHVAALSGAREERDALRAEVERLRKDAERYQWLANYASAGQWDTIAQSGDVDAIDAAVDAAIAGRAGEKTDA